MVRYLYIVITFSVLSCTHVEYIYNDTLVIYNNYDSMENKLIVSDSSLLSNLVDGHEFTINENSINELKCVNFSSASVETLSNLMRDFEYFGHDFTKLCEAGYLMYNNHYVKVVYEKSHPGKDHEKYGYFSVDSMILVVMDKNSMVKSVVIVALKMVFKGDLIIRNSKYTNEKFIVYHEDHNGDNSLPFSWRKVKSIYYGGFVISDDGHIEVVKIIK